jgi:hypothetical protein
LSPLVGWVLGGCWVRFRVSIGLVQGDVAIDTTSLLE